MKVAKADEKEFDKVYDFINVMDELFDSRFFSHEEEWRNWDDDDEDKKLLLEIEEDLFYTSSLKGNGKRQTGAVLSRG